MAFCRIYVIFMFSFLGRYRAQNKNPEITENLYFWIYKAQMHVDLFSDHYFNFLSVKTDILEIKMEKGNNLRIFCSTAAFENIRKIIIETVASNYVLEMTENKDISEREL